MILTNSGNFGIGTTTPQTKLEVNGDINVGVNGGAAAGLGAKLNFFGAQINQDALWFSRFNVSDNSTHLRLNIGDDYWGDDAFIIGNTRFDQPGWNTFLSVYNNGRVGIGTSTPQASLEVNGDINVGINGGPATGTGAKLHFFGATINQDDFWLARENYSNNSTALRLNIGDDNLGDDSFIIGNTLNGQSTWSTFLSVYNNGKVGIGTATPQAKLEVNGDANIGSDAGSSSGYGAKLSFLGASNNSDPLWISRYNNGSNTTQLRLNIGDDNFGDDAFIIGNHLISEPSQFRSFFTVINSGNIGIGTDAPDAKLAVNGSIHTEEVRVDVDGAMVGDYVFEKEYKLLPLREVEGFVNKNKHLPEVPSAKDFDENGMNLKEMNLLLLKKVEELTLHLIEMEKKNERQQAQIDLLEKKVR